MAEDWTNKPVNEPYIDGNGNYNIVFRLKLPMSATEDVGNYLYVATPQVRIDEGAYMSNANVDIQSTRADHYKMLGLMMIAFKYGKDISGIFELGPNTLYETQGAGAAAALDQGPFAEVDWVDGKITESEPVVEPIVIDMMMGDETEFTSEEVASGFIRIKITYNGKRFKNLIRAPRPWEDSTLNLGALALKIDKQRFSEQEEHETFKDIVDPLYILSFEDYDDFTSQLGGFMERLEYYQDLDKRPKNNEWVYFDNFGDVTWAGEMFILEQLQNDVQEYLKVNKISLNSPFYMFINRNELKVMYVVRKTRKIGKILKNIEKTGQKIIDLITARWTIHSQIKVSGPLTFSEVEAVETGPPVQATVSDGKTTVAVGAEVVNGRKKINDLFIELEKEFKSNVATYGLMFTRNVIDKFEYLNSSNDFDPDVLGAEVDEAGNTLGQAKIDKYIKSYYKSAPLSLNNSPSALDKINNDTGQIGPLFFSSLSDERAVNFLLNLAKFDSSGDGNCVSIEKIEVSTDQSSIDSSGPLPLSEFVRKYIQLSDTTLKYYDPEGSRYTDGRRKKANIAPIANTIDEIKEQPPVPQTAAEVRSEQAQLDDSSNRRQHNVGLDTHVTDIRDNFMIDISHQGTQITSLLEAQRKILSKVTIRELAERALACMNITFTIEDVIDMFCDATLTAIFGDPEKAVHYLEQIRNIHQVNPATGETIFDGEAIYQQLLGEMRRAATNGIIAGVNNNPEVLEAYRDVEEFFDTTMGDVAYAAADSLSGDDTPVMTLPENEKLKTLRKGSKGKLVELLQTLLNLMIFGPDYISEPVPGSSSDIKPVEVDGTRPLKIDGNFGPKTKKMVKAYQGGSSLKKDGVVGPKTWKRLVSDFKIVSKTSPVRATKQKTLKDKELELLQPKDVEGVVNALTKDTKTVICMVIVGGAAILVANVKELYEMLSQTGPAAVTNLYNRVDDELPAKKHCPGKINININIYDALGYLYEAHGLDAFSPAQRLQMLQDQMQDYIDGLVERLVIQRINDLIERLNNLCPSQDTRMGRLPSAGALSPEALKLPPNMNEYLNVDIDFGKYITQLFLVLTPLDICRLLGGTPSNHLVDRVYYFNEDQGYEVINQKFTIRKSLIYFYKSIGDLADLSICEKIEEIYNITESLSEYDICNDGDGKYAEHARALAAIGLSPGDIADQLAADQLLKKEVGKSLMDMINGVSSNPANPEQDLKNMLVDSAVHTTARQKVADNYFDGVKGDLYDDTIQDITNALIQRAQSSTDDAGSDYTTFFEIFTFTQPHTLSPDKLTGFWRKGGLPAVSSYVSDFPDVEKAIEIIEKGPPIHYNLDSIEERLDKAQIHPVVFGGASVPYDAEGEFAELVELSMAKLVSVNSTLAHMGHLISLLNLPAPLQEWLSKGISDFTSSIMLLLGQTEYKPSVGEAHALIGVMKEGIPAMAQQLRDLEFSPLAPWTPSSATWGTEVAGQSLAATISEQSLVPAAFLTQDLSPTGNYYSDDPLGPATLWNEMCSSIVGRLMIGREEGAKATFAPENLPALLLKLQSPEYDFFKIEEIKQLFKTVARNNFKKGDLSESAAIKNNDALFETFLVLVERMETIPALFSLLAYFVAYPEASELLKNPDVLTQLNTTAGQSSEFTQMAYKHLHKIKLLRYNETLDIDNIKYNALAPLDTALVGLTTSDDPPSCDPDANFGPNFPLAVSAQNNHYGFPVLNENMWVDTRLIGSEKIPIFANPKYGATGATKPDAIIPADLDTLIWQTKNVIDASDVPTGVDLDLYEWQKQQTPVRGGFFFENFVQFDAINVKGALQSAAGSLSNITIFDSWEEKRAQIKEAFPYLAQHPDGDAIFESDSSSRPITFSTEETIELLKIVGGNTSYFDNTEKKELMIPLGWYVAPDEENSWEISNGLPGSGIWYSPVWDMVSTMANSAKLFGYYSDRITNMPAGPAVRNFIGGSQTPLTEANVNWILRTRLITPQLNPISQNHIFETVPLRDARYTRAWTGLEDNEVEPERKPDTNAAARNPTSVGAGGRYLGCAIPWDTRKLGGTGFKHWQDKAVPFLNKIGYGGSNPQSYKTSRFWNSQGNKTDLEQPLSGEHPRYHSREEFNVWYGPQLFPSGKPAPALKQGARPGTDVGTWNYLPTGTTRKFSLPKNMKELKSLFLNLYEKTGQAVAEPIFKTPNDFHLQKIFDEDTGQIVEREQTLRIPIQFGVAAPGEVITDDGETKEKVGLINGIQYKDSEDDNQYVAATTKTIRIIRVYKKVSLEDNTAGDVADTVSVSSLLPNLKLGIRLNYLLRDSIVDLFGNDVGYWDAKSAAIDGPDNLTYSSIASTADDIPVAYKSDGILGHVSQRPDTILFDRLWLPLRFIIDQATAATDRLFGSQAIKDATGLQKVPLALRVGEVAEPLQSPELDVLNETSIDPATATLRDLVKLLPHSLAGMPHIPCTNIDLRRSVIYGAEDHGGNYAGQVADTHKAGGVESPDPPGQYQIPSPFANGPLYLYGKGIWKELSCLLQEGSTWDTLFAEALPIKDIYSLYTAYLLYALAAEEGQASSNQDYNSALIPFLDELRKDIIKLGEQT
jgi:hypothetical protein